MLPPTNVNEKDAIKKTKNNFKNDDCSNFGVFFKTYINILEYYFGSDNLIYFSVWLLT